MIISVTLKSFYSRPVPNILLFVRVVERVVIVLPDVVLGVDVVFVDVVSHVYVSEDVLELRVVVVGNGGEGVEEIGVD